MGCLIEYYDTENILPADYSIAYEYKNDYASAPSRSISTRREHKVGSFEKNYLNPDETYYFEGYDNTQWFSSVICNEYGVYMQTPSLTYTFKSAVSLNGLSIYFSNDPVCVPFSIDVTWTKSDNTTVKESAYPSAGKWLVIEKKLEKVKSIKIEIIDTYYPYTRARIYRIEFGLVEIFDNEGMIHCEMTEGINVVPTEVEVHTSNIQLLGTVSPTMRKLQKYDIYHIDSTGEEHFMGQHLTTGILQSGKTISLKGANPYKILEHYYIPSSMIGVFKEQNLYSWIMQIYDNRALGVTIEYPGDLGNLIIKGRFEERISLRTAFTALALAANLYIDCNTSNKITMKKINSLYEQTESTFNIPETQVFEGDNIEYKTAYKYLKITVKSGDNLNYTFTKTNSADIDTDTSKDISALLYSSITEDNGSSSMLNAESQYYFHNVFYNAKCLCDDSENCYGIVGKRGTINGHDCILTNRKLNLDGNKLLSEGTYIYLGEAD